jgi:DNA polymerase-3 subunit beta
MVEVLEEGSITAPAKKLFDIIRELPEEPFEISVGKNHAIQIRGERASFRLMGLPHDDFPKLPTFTEEKRIEIEQNLLKECLNLTAFAISHDETRYVLNGLLLMMQNGKLKLVGTDGRRLAVIEKALPSPPPW